MWRTEQRRVAGRSLAWRRAGVGPPVLFLHDAGAETLAAPALDDLAADCEVVAPWLPGYGRSERLAPETTPAAMGAMVAALIAELGWPAATVSGTSLGGWFALEAALAAPERVTAVVVCNPAGLHVPEDYLMRLFAEGDAADDAPRLTAAMAVALPPDERDVTGLPPALATAVLGPFVQPLAAATSCGWHPALANPRLLGRLPQVRCPVTILWGGRDPLIPLAHGHAMADVVPQARLEVLDGAGHLPPLEAPERVAAAVRQAVAAPTGAGGPARGAASAHVHGTSTGAGPPAATLGDNPMVAEISPGPMELLTADTPDRLEAALGTLADLGVVGVDVERADSERYFRTPALIQVGGEGRVALIDPLALDDLLPLQTFLSGRLTVLHALDNDLVPLASAGVRPPSLADTAVAASLLGLPTGLERLLEDLLGVTLPGDKEQMQRADWEARPLTEDMRAYAAADVADLPALWRELADRLAQTGRAGWYQEELAALLAQPALEERRAWTRLRGIGRLDDEGRRRVRALWHRRESLARSTDTAPSRIAPDRLLVDLASAPPTSPRELGRRGMRRESVRRFGSALIEAAERPDVVATPGDADDADAALGRSRRPSQHEKALSDQLRSLRAELAEDLGIDAGVLCPSRAITAAVLAGPRTVDDLRTALALRDWQWQLLAPAFCEAFGLDRDEGQDGGTAAEADTDTRDATKGR